MISVVICSHNPRADVIARTLAGLRKQRWPLHAWELLIVDNASERPLAATVDVSWHPRGRHVREETVGLVFARLRGIADTRGRLLVFVDDDNVLGPDYLEQVDAISRRFTDLGAFGAGILEPEFEHPPSPTLVPRLGMLAIRSGAQARRGNDPNDWQMIPWGAGLCVTRAVAERYTHLIQSLAVSTVLGRRGEALFAGEDDVFSWAAVSAGLTFGVFPELRITHLIPDSRLRPAYLVRLTRDRSFSDAVLQYRLQAILPRRIQFVDYLRMPLHGLRRGVFSMRCHWAQLRGADRAATFVASHLAARPVTPC